MPVVVVLLIAILPTSKYQDLYDPHGDGNTRNLNQSGRDATFGDVSPAFSDFEPVEACLRREKQFNRRVELTGKNRLVTYVLKIEVNERNLPVIAHEELRYKRGRYGSPYRFLNFQYGEGYAITSYLMEQHPDRFEEVKRKMRERVPGVENIEVNLTDDGRLLMRYKDGAFIDKNVSDGTVKMFAYLILLHDPLPHPILCVEEPENQLYPELMEILAEEFIDYANRGGQVFVSTHSPQFLNAVPLDSLYLIEKTNGISDIYRAREDKILAGQVAEGWKPGTLWEQGEFNGVANRIKAGI